MIKVRIWMKDAVEPIVFVAQTISFLNRFVVITEDIGLASFIPIEMIRVMERTTVEAENIINIPEAFGDPVRSGTLIPPEPKKTPKKRKVKLLEVN